MPETFDDRYLSGPFDHSWESLRTFECPAWFRDAKLAYWSHWGPQSVPMFGEWYARELYVEGTDDYRHHRRIYGHPSKVGWKDIIPLWKAENFDPDGLMKLFVDAGAKYFLSQAIFCDNFDNFDSRHHRWNSVKMGPHKDIVQLWKNAAHKYGLPYGTSEHLACAHSWWRTNKGADVDGPYAGVPYDGNDPEFADLYFNNKRLKKQQVELGYNLPGDGAWYTEDESFHHNWFRRMKDVIDKYQPDLLYSDGPVPFGEYGRRIVAHLYNTSAALYGVNRAVYNQKDTSPEVYTIGILDIERSQLSDIAEFPWQTDTSVGNWYYHVKDAYKTAPQVLETLVDIVSNNGNLVMNIPQKPDGTLDEECTYILSAIAAWMKAGNGKGIFGSRPWTHSSEGPSKHVQEERWVEKSVKWTPDDYRFTRNGDTVFAYQMAPSIDGSGIIRSLATEKVRRVSSLQSMEFGPIDFIQTSTGLNYKLLKQPSADGPIGFVINFE